MRDIGLVGSVKGRAVIFPALFSSVVALFEGSGTLELLVPGILTCSGRLLVRTWPDPLLIIILFNQFLLRSLFLSSLCFPSSLSLGFSLWSSWRIKLVPIRGYYNLFIYINLIIIFIFVNNY